MKKILDTLSLLFSFLRPGGTQDLKEFSELITGQYQFLVDQLEKILKDYFEISTQVREMHREILDLKKELAQATAERCKMLECKERMQ